MSRWWVSFLCKLTWPTECCFVDGPRTVMVHLKVPLVRVFVPLATTVILYAPSAHFFFGGSARSVCLPPVTISFKTWGRYMDSTEWLYNIFQLFAGWESLQLNSAWWEGFWWSEVMCYQRWDEFAIYKSTGKGSERSIESYIESKAFRSLAAGETSRYII